MAIRRLTWAGGIAFGTGDTKFALDVVPLFYEDPIVVEQRVVEIEQKYNRVVIDGIKMGTHRGGTDATGFCAG